MRLLCTIEDLGCGGAQRQLVLIARALRERGHYVEFFTYYPDDHYKAALTAAGIPVHTTVKRHRFSVDPVVRLRRLVVRGEFDSVLSFLDTPNLYAELALLGRKSVRLVVSERNTFPDEGGRVGRRLQRALHRRAYVVTTNARTQQRWLERECPWLRGRVQTIYNGVDLSTFRPAEPQAVPRPCVRILGAGRVVPQKNLLGLIAAIAIARVDLGLEVTVDWAGRCEDQEYHAACSRALRDAGLQCSWEWLGQRSDMPTLMPGYDALILPSLWEGLPNVVCEALAVGLPVLASSVSDNPHLVADGERGFLFPPDSPGETARAIGRFARLTPEARAAMGGRARCFAEAELSIERCVDVYERLLSGHIEP